MHKNTRPKAMKEGYYMILDPNDEEDMSLLRERSFDILIDATTEGVNEKEWNKYVAYGTYLVNENNNSQMQNRIFSIHAI
jgi:hypothetical protein